MPWTHGSAAASFRPSQTWSFKNEQYAALCRVRRHRPHRSRRGRRVLRAGLPVRVVLRDPPGAGLGRARRRDRSSRLTDADAFDARLDGRAAPCRQPAAVRASRPVRTRRRIALTVARAAVAARVPKLVALSSVGADLASGSGWIRMNRMLEQRLSDSGIAATFVRRGLFHGELDAHDRAGCRHRRAAVVPVPADGASRWWRRTWAGQARSSCLSNGRRARSPCPARSPIAGSDVLAALAAELGKPLRLDTLAQDGWAGAMAGRVFARGAGRIHRDDARSEQRAYRHGYGSCRGALGGIDPLAVGGMARAVRGAST